MAALVVDASVSAAWFLEDETSSLTEAALDQVVRDGAAVPAIWAYEMANVLVMAERRGRIDPAGSASIREALLALPVHTDDAATLSLLPAIVGMARAHRLSAYDAAYLELSVRTGLALATRDAGLRAAAEQLGVPLFAG
jgi:predicted nucleic acid-binding protein